MFWKKKKELTVKDYEPMVISLSEQFQDYDYLGYSTPHYVDNKTKEVTDSIVLLFYEHKTLNLRKIVQLPRHQRPEYENHPFFIKCVLWTTGQYTHRACIFNPTKLLIERLLKEGYTFQIKDGDAAWVPIQNQETKKYIEATLEQKKKKEEEKIIKVDFSNKDRKE